jgi:hypothetical protein
VKAAEPFQPVVPVLREVEQLAGEQRHVGAHDRDVRVVGADIAFLDRARRVHDRGFDGAGDVGREPGPVIAGDLQQRDAVEVGPVPVGRTHLVQGLLHEPRPDAIGPARRVGVLEGDNAPHDRDGTSQVFGLAGVEQAERVVQRVPGRMDEAAGQRGVVAWRRKRPAHHLFRRVVLAVP